MTCKIGDLILFKRSGGDAEAMAIARKVQIFNNLQAADMDKIEVEYNDRIKADAAFWQAKRTAVQGVLIDLAEVIPVRVEKKYLPTSREGWIISETDLMLHRR